MQTRREQRNLNNKRSFFILLTFLSYSALSQTSVFQDASGESAYKIFDKAITVNAKDESISFSSDLITTTASTTRFNIFGVTAKVNANEGIANLKKENTFLLDGEIGIYRGWKRTSPIPLVGVAFVHEKYFSLNVNFDRTNLFDFSRFPDKVVFEKSSTGWKAEVGWFGYYGDMLWGVSSNLYNKTNVDDLDAHNILSLQQSTNNDSILDYTEKKAFDLNEFNQNLTTFNLNGDISYLLRTSGPGLGAIFLVGHFRFKAQESSMPEFNPGAGLYLSKPLAPQDIVAGLSIQLNDAFNVKSKGSGWSRISINLTAGFKL